MSHRDEPQSASILVYSDYIKSFSILSCKEYNQSDFSIDHLVMSIVELSLVLLEEGACYEEYILLAKLY